MKKIQILGTGCPKCEKLEVNAREAVAQLGIEAEVEKVKDLNRIADAGVMMTPALAVDGKVMVSRKVASVAEIAGWLRE